MEESLEFGDLIITKNIDTSILQKDNIVAFKNARNTVTVHKIKNIEVNNDKQRKFNMYYIENETNDTKVVNDTAIEGILVKRISKLGLIIMIIQEPLVTLLIIIIILVIGLIVYYIAQQLDKKDEKKSEDKKDEDDNKEDSNNGKINNNSKNNKDYSMTNNNPKNNSDEFIEKNNDEIKNRKIEKAKK